LGGRADRELSIALLERNSKTSANVPSLDEAERVVSFVLHDQLGQLAGKVASGTSTAESLREMLGLTIAVVGAVESMHRSIGRPYPEQWESMERSAETFTDHFVVKWIANADAELKQSITKHRRRKLTAKAGALRLVESDRNKRARWAQVTLPGDAPLPIAEEVGEGLGELTLKTEERLYQLLGAVATNDPLVLAGQVVGLLSAAECLLALFPSNEVAAFCVQLAVYGAARET
jgi:hypothetical protein